MARTLDEISLDVADAKVEIKIAENAIIDLQDEIEWRRREIRKQQARLKELGIEREKLQPKLLGD